MSNSCRGLESVYQLCLDGPWGIRTPECSATGCIGHGAPQMEVARTGKAVSDQVRSDWS